jgi:hypothetical protein
MASAGVEFVITFNRPTTTGNFETLFHVAPAEKFVAEYKA